MGQLGAVGELVELRGVGGEAELGGAGILSAAGWSAAWVSGWELRKGAAACSNAGALGFRPAAGEGETADPWGGLGLRPGKTNVQWGQQLVTVRC